MKHHLVVPFDTKLLEKLSGQSLIGRTTSADEIVAIGQTVRSKKNPLRSIWLTTETPLSALPFTKAWLRLPLTLQVGSLGRFRDVAPHLPLLRKRDVWVFLPSNGPDTFFALPVLASVGVRCGVWLDGRGSTDWDVMQELLDYSAYGRVRHAPMEPFQFLVTQFKETKYLDISPIYFDDAARFLHLDGHANIALSAADLAAGTFIATGLSALDTIAELPEYKKHLDRRQSFFLDNHPCARCSGWRACGGWFSETRDQSPGCTEFFESVIEAAHFLREKRAARGKKNRKRGR